MLRTNHQHSRIHLEVSLLLLGQRRYAARGVVDGIGLVGRAGQAGPSPAIAIEDERDVTQALAFVGVVGDDGGDEPEPNGIDFRADAAPVAGAARVQARKREVPRNSSWRRFSPISVMLSLSRIGTRFGDGSTLSTMSPMSPINVTAAAAGFPAYSVSQRTTPIAATTSDAASSSRLVEMSI